MTARESLHAEWLKMYMQMFHTFTQEQLNSAIEEDIDISIKHVLERMKENVLCELSFQDNQLLLIALEEEK
jgi:hypothetical protein